MGSGSSLDQKTLNFVGENVYIYIILYKII